ncbi:actin-like ATPase domain-containing protein [Auricularia subglabra TFB-10046 SS5]|nr:actin-like ATPase domain-containing protein [Auricularia subglabra TFB-10046 SS5]
MSLTPVDHNHRSVATVRSCLQHLTNSTRVLCFDTLFHASLPPHIYTGVAAFLGKPQNASSMSVSPLEGAPGGTRSGSVVPVLVFYHTPGYADMVEQGGGLVSKAELAICGTSDFGKILSRMADADDTTARLAYDVPLDRVPNFVGAYMLKLADAGARVDGVVFSGGIGERAARLRADVARYLGAFGGELDRASNEEGEKDGLEAGNLRVQDGRGDAVRAHGTRLGQRPPEAELVDDQDDPDNVLYNGVPVELASYVQFDLGLARNLRNPGWCFSSNHPPSAVTEMGDSTDVSVTVFSADASEAVCGMSTIAGPYGPASLY